MADAWSQAFQRGEQVGYVQGWRRGVLTGAALALFGIALAALTLHGLQSLRPFLHWLGAL